VDLHAIDLGLAVYQPDSGVVSEVHLGELPLLFGRTGAGRMADLPARHFCILSRRNRMHASRLLLLRS
jgi:hypothetical protein